MRQKVFIHLIYSLFHRVICSGDLLLQQVLQSLWHKFSFLPVCGLLTSFMESEWQEKEFRSFPPVFKVYYVYKDKWSVVATCSFHSYIPPGAGTQILCLSLRILSPSEPLEQIHFMELFYGVNCKWMQGFMHSSFLCCHNRNLLMLYQIISHLLKKVFPGVFS